MTQSIQLHTGTVKFSAGKVFETQYGQRINCVVSLANGEETKLWGNPDDSALLALKKGQQVQLMKDQKGYKLISEATPEQPSQASPQASSGSNEKRLPPTWTDDERRAIAARTEQHAKLMKYCHDQIKTQFGDGLSEESLRTLTITLYLQNCK